MVVYGDVLFLLNLFLDYALLLATAKIAACPFVRLRVLLGALFGAVYAVLVFVPGLQFLAALPLRLASGAVMVLLAYGGERRIFHLLLIFAAVSAALGGSVLALTTVGGATFYRGVATTGADLQAVVLCGSVGCALLTLLFRRKGARLRRRDFAEIRLTLGERSTTFRALVDTGNTLTDRQGRRVIVADWQVFAELLPERGALNRSDFACPSSGFQKLTRLLEPGRARLLSFRTVGVSDGLILAIRPDAVVINGRNCPGMLVAGSAHPVSDGGEYRGLVGPEEIGGIA